MISIIKTFLKKVPSKNPHIDLVFVVQYLDRLVPSVLHFSISHGQLGVEQFEDPMEQRVVVGRGQREQFGNLVLLELFLLKIFCIIFIIKKNF